MAFPFKGGGHAIVVASASFDPDVEYMPDPGFDNAGIGTQTRCVVAGSALTATSNTSPSYTAPAAATLAPGTYRCVYTVPVAFAAGFPGISIAGGGITNDSSRAAGVHTQDIVVSTVTNQNIGFFFNSSNNGKSITDLSVKRIA